MANVHLGIVVLYGRLDSKNVKNPARTRIVNLKPLTTCSAYLINANEDVKLLGCSKPLFDFDLTPNHLLKLLFVVPFCNSC